MTNERQDGREGGGEVMENKRDVKPRAPDGGWGWVVLFSSFIIHLIYCGIRYSFGIFVPVLKDEFKGSSLASIAFIPSLLYGISTGAGPVASALIKKYGFRTVTMVGAIISAIGLAISAVANSILFLYISVGIITGIGFGLINLPCIMPVLMYFDKKRAFAVGTALCGAGFGTFILAPITATLINHLGWKNSFLVLGNIVMLIFFLAILFRPLLSPSNASKEETNDPNQAQRESEETTRDIQNHRRGCLSWGICASNSLKNAIDLSIFKDGLFVMFVISNLLSNTALNVPYIFTVDRAKVLGFSNRYASLLLMVIGIANTAGRVIVGFICDRRWIRVLYLYIICHIIAGLAMILSNFCQDLTTQTIWCIVFGMTTCVSHSVVLTDLIGIDKVTNAYGLIMLFQGIASLIGPPLVGWMYDVTGDYNIGFYIAGAAFSLSGVILLISPLIERKRNGRNLDENSPLLTS